MGQKVNPRILRTPYVKSWQSKWFAKLKDFRTFLKRDVLIRKFLSKRLKGSSVGNIEIEREGEIWRIVIRTAKPGMIIGRGGVDVEKLKKEMEKKFLEKGVTLELQIKEITAPFLSAQIIVENITADLEKRMPFRRVAKRTIEQIKKAGAQGAKIIVKGRLDGGEIARQETFPWGKMPLHTLRADIDYARGAAHTIYGAVGIKVWICRGEVFNNQNNPNNLNNPKEI